MRVVGERQGAGAAEKAKERIRQAVVAGGEGARFVSMVLGRELGL